MMKRILCALISFCLTSLAFAQPGFVVDNITIEGLQNLDPLTVKTYVPIKPGQRLAPAKTASIVKALYKTNFFDKISLERRGNTLVINVVERPTIGSLKIKGNSLIPTDKLTAALKAMDIAEGRNYNPSLVERVKKSLLNQYYQLGHYNARVHLGLNKLSRNRVAVSIIISEGVTAKVKGITIIGNHAFSEKELISHLDATTPGPFTFITRADRYSEDKLEKSMEQLRNFYLDKGYLRIQVKTSQAQVTTDRKSVYLTFVVAEGKPYRVKDITLSGTFPVPKATLMKLVTVKPQSVFSRQEIIDSEKAISKFLGKQGYLFATINLKPTINEATHEVSIELIVAAGKRTYVRHVSFSDNTRTNDNVLRREVVQMEAAPVSTVKLEESKHRLSLLPFIKEVTMSVDPVPNTTDQVDVHYKIKEDSANQANFKIGYSPEDGFVVGAGLNQKNFLGTGNSLGINFQRTNIQQFYSIDYTNPYYTPDGISRSLSFSISRTDPGKNQKVVSDYITNEYDIGMVYGVPISQEEGVYNRVIGGIIYQNTLLYLMNNVSAQVADFTNRHGRHFQELDFRLGYIRDSRDRAIFPTSGTTQSLFLDAYAPLSSRSLSFYILNYHGKWYQPLFGDFIALMRADLGYGNGLHGVKDYPFFRNFFAGGMGSVRGFQPSTLGPRDSTVNSNGYGNALGGNMLVDGSISLIFPNHISDNLRTSVFLDAGNVYSPTNNRNFGGGSTNSGPPRFSTGLEVDWLTPFGEIELAFAKPLNSRKGDALRSFDFGIGANF